MGSLSNTQARLFHGDNLKNIPIEERKLLEEVVWLHTRKCRHPRCTQVSHRTDSLQVPIIDQLIWLSNRE